MARKTVNYINNKDFTQALIEHKDDIEKALAEGKELPRPSNYIGLCIMDIAKNLARKSNFCNYPFKEDMILDGVENSLSAIKSFNPEKSNNAFAYFTTITYYAFIRRIEKEKKLLYTKYKYSEKQLMIGDTYDGEFFNIALETDHMDEFIRNYEEKLENKKQKQKEKQQEKEDNG